MFTAYRPATTFRMTGSGTMAGSMKGPDGNVHVFVNDGATLRQVDVPGATATPTLMAINAAGDAVLTAPRPGDGLTRTYVAYHDGTVISVGEFAATDLRVTGRAINSSGTVIGVSDQPVAPSNFPNPQGFVYNPSLGMRPMPSVGFTTAELLNEQNWIAGSLGSNMLYVWSPDRGVMSIPPIDASDSRSQATALSSSMLVGGTSVTGNPLDIRGWYWTPAAGKQYISAPSHVDPQGVNDAGVVVGNVWDGILGYPRAFAWTTISGLHLLAPLGARDWTSATTINAQGLIGGFAYSNTLPSVAVVWTLAEGPVDLNTRLQGTGIPTLDHVAAISDAGVIAAFGTDGYVYLLTPIP